MATRVHSMLMRRHTIWDTPPPKRVELSQLVLLISTRCLTSSGHVRSSLRPPGAFCGSRTFLKQFCTYPPSPLPTVNPFVRKFPQLLGEFRKFSELEWDASLQRSTLSTLSIDLRLCRLVQLAPFRGGDKHSRRGFKVIHWLGGDIERVSVGVFTAHVVIEIPY